MGRVWITLVVAVTTLAATSSTGTATSGPDHATFEYGLGSHATGHVQGSCDAALMDLSSFPSRRVLVSGASARLHTFETRVESTHVGPIVERDVEQTEDVREVALPVWVSWAPDGRAVAIERPAVLPTDAGAFQASFATTSARAGPALADLEGVSFWDARHGPPVWSLAGVPDARTVTADDARWDLKGDFALFLEDASVGQLSTGPSHEIGDGSAPSNVQQADVYRHAVLDIVQGDTQIDAFRAGVACRGLEAAIRGSLTAYEATGEVRRGSYAIPFARRELRLEGDLFLSESPRTGDDQRIPVTATGVGSFRAVELDFAGTPWTPTDTEAVAAAAGVVALAAALGLWKLAAFLFTRLKPDDLLDRDGRRRVYDAVQANPGSCLAEIVATTGMSEGNARYHLRVLKRHGRVRSFKVHSTWRFALITVDGHEARQRSLKENDPMLRRLLELLSTGPVAAKSLVEALQRESGLSRSGGWKVVDRAHEAQLVLKEKQGKKVMVRSL